MVRRSDCALGVHLAAVGLTHVLGPRVPAATVVADVVGLRFDERLRVIEDLASLIEGRLRDACHLGVVELQWQARFVGSLCLLGGAGLIDGGCPANIGSLGREHPAQVLPYNLLVDPGRPVV